jgi:hypothetical protein
MIQSRGKLKGKVYGSNDLDVDLKLGIENISYYLVV